LPPTNVSNSWCGPLTIRERFWRFLGFHQAAAKPAPVKLFLEGLELRDLPNNLLGTGAFSDLTPPDSGFVAPPDGITVGDSTDASYLLGPTGAAPVNSSAGAPPAVGPTSDPVALADAAPTLTGPLTPADLLFQNGFGDPFANPYANLLSDSLQGTPAAATKPPSSRTSITAPAAGAARGLTPTPSPIPALFPVRRPVPR
jgi:hypothetical protein